MVYTISRAVCLFLCKIFIRLKVEGKNNIPKQGGFILASNHISFLDPIILCVVCQRRLNFLARHTLFRDPAFGWLLLHLNVVPLKRGTADLSALKEAMARLRAGGGLLLFPQGARQQSSEFFGGAQPGVGFLAAKLNVPVIPAFIQGTERAMSRGAKFIHPAKVKLIFGKQILIERGMPYRAFAGNVMEKIRHLSCSIT
ncbi:MAG: lysophospholipid acyltransferase family protein [Candidatus Omnitrophota bacterium]|nr:lysophospholipid acyltransferase family protein [Candidatus Omnitrophota bacterium]